MLTRLRPIGALLVACLPLAACSVDAFTYTVSRYGTVKETHVHLGCRDTYEVFDRPERGTLLVVTTPLNEVILDACGGPASQLTGPERMRRVAAIFLDERSNRPGCTVTSTTPVDALHTEYVYRCDGPPPPALNRPRRAG